LYGSPAIWNGLEAIQHICGPQGGVCQGSDWTNNVVLDQKQILTDRGWNDHVAPPQVLVNCAQWGCGYVYGFRVPLIVISALCESEFHFETAA
jgi:hypothetical protein